MSYITVAAATITSVPLDFKGNLARILESIRLAKEQGAKLRTGPEVCQPTRRLYKITGTRVLKKREGIVGSPWLWMP